MNTSGLDRRRFLIITINHSNAGFFSYVNFVLNQLAYAERQNLRPVVYFGPRSGDGPNAYYEPEVGDNMWDYYFEPVSDCTYSDLARRIADPDDPLSQTDLVWLNTGELWRLHGSEPESVYPYPHGIYFARFEDDPDWYLKQRARAHRLITKYVRIKPHVLVKVDAFQRDHFNGQRVVGVHMRGTDKGTAKLPPALMRIVRPEEYFPYIDEYTKKHGYCKIFVATEQAQFLHRMKARYGERVLSNEAIRTSGLRNPFHLEGNGYRKGEDVLIDCLLLSRSDYMLKCTSAVGEFAMYFNPGLRCVDLNHAADRISRWQLLAIQLRHGAWSRYYNLKRGRHTL